MAQSRMIQECNEFHWASSDFEISIINMQLFVAINTLYRRYINLNAFDYQARSDMYGMYW